MSKHEPFISLVVAIGENGAIGRGGNLPWRISTDLKYFRKVTMGKPMIMGRKTFESIGKPLPGRRNIVVTRDTNYHREGIEVVHGTDEALAVTADVPEVMVIGGAELFRTALPLAGRIHLTRVHGNIEGNVMWPALDTRQWEVIERERHESDDRHAYAMTFEVWEKRK